MAKVDNANKTGTGGGKQSKFSELDRIILDIMGKDSPGVRGLGQMDSFGNVDECDNIARTQSPTPLPLNCTITEAPATTLCSNITFCEPAPHSAGNTGSCTTPRTQVAAKRKVHRDSTIESLKKRKLELQVEYLELSNRKLRLELLEKERALGLQQHSDKHVGNNSDTEVIYVHPDTDIDGEPVHTIYVTSDTNVNDNAL